MDRARGRAEIGAGAVERLAEQRALQRLVNDQTLARYVLEFIAQNSVPRNKALTIAKNRRQSRRTGPRVRRENQCAMCCCATRCASSRSAWSCAFSAGEPLTSAAQPTSPHAA